MVKIKSDFEFDAQDSEELLAVLENLSRDLGHIQDRQERLAEMGVLMGLEIEDGEIQVNLTAKSE